MFFNCYHFEYKFILKLCTILNDFEFQYLYRLYSYNNVFNEHLFCFLKNNKFQSFDNAQVLHYSLILIFSDFEPTYSYRLYSYKESDLKFSLYSSLAFYR